MKMSPIAIGLNFVLLVSLLLVFAGVTGHWAAKDTATVSFVYFVANCFGYVEGILKTRKEKPEPATCGCQHCN